MKERDEARAGQPQAAAGPFQTPSDQGMQQLRQELEAANQELGRFRAHTCAPTNADKVARMQSQLQEAQAALRAQQAAVPLSDAQARLVALEQECQRAKGRIQELLEEGQKLQTEHKELQITHTVKVAQLEGQLKVGQMERRTPKATANGG